MGRRRTAEGRLFFFKRPRARALFAPLSPPFSSRSFTVIAVVRGKEEGWRRRPPSFFPWTARLSRVAFFAVAMHQS